MKPIAAFVAAYLALSNGLAYGADTVTFDIGGVARQAILHAPRDPHGGDAETPKPLVIVLHGLGGTGQNAQGLGFAPLSVREGFVAAYPDGIEKRWDYGRQLNRPMPEIDGKKVDDIAFFRALIDRAVIDANVDRTRVYLAGLSNGGLMAHRIACAMDREIAAVASYISGMTNWQAQGCRRERAVPILVLGGTDDTFQSYAGTSGNLNGYLLSVPNTVAIWRIRNGCKKGADENLPDLDPDDGTTVALTRYMDCTGDAEILFYRIVGGGHRPPMKAQTDIAPRPPYGRTNRDIDTAEVSWDFFRRFRLDR